ncbi:MAG TPA: copper resistance protein CopC, partial [Ilumatobacteraceae bacterium]|nr:copper resistance protein CopC [Ilumatobacteraceae bacterium]
ACAAGLTLAALVGVGQASAHSQLLSSDPQAGEVLDQAPAHVTLTFNEDVEISLGAIRVFDGTGKSVDVSAARHPDGEGKVVEVDLPKLANGSYVVDWRVVSADSHPVHAAYTFQVGPDSNLAPGLLDQVISSSHTGRAAGVGLAVSRSLVTAAIAIVFGGLLICGLGIVPFGQRQRLVITGAAIVGAVAGLLALPMEVGYTAGRSLGVITDRSAWRAVGKTTIGLAWVIRAAGILLTAEILLLTRSRCRQTWWQVIAIIGLVVVGTASAYGGHGAAGRWHYMGVFLTILHVSAMAMWLGGLAMLVISFKSVERTAVIRFSSIAIVAVSTIVVTGSVQALRQVGSLDALTGTSYGKLLIWKAVIVAAVLAVAAVARKSTHGRLALTGYVVEVPVGASVGASVGAAAVVDDGFDRVRLRRAVSIEALLAVGIVVLTSLLMAANPSLAASSAPFSSTLTSNGYLATVNVVPARVGTNEIHLYLSSPSSSLDQPDNMTVTIQDPSRGVNPIAIDVIKAGPGHYTTNTATFPYASTWRLVITARYAFNEVVFTADVKVV